MRIKYLVDKFQKAGFKARAQEWAGKDAVILEDVTFREMSLIDLIVENATMGLSDEQAVVDFEDNTIILIPDPEFWLS